MSDRTATIKPARIDLGDGDTLNLYRMNDYVTVVRFHGNNPNTQLSSAQVSTVALRDALDQVAPAGSCTRTDEPDEGAHIGPEGEVDWHGLYLSENRRAEKAERERDARDAAAHLWKETARRAIRQQAFLNSAAVMEQEMAMSESLVAGEAVKRAERAERLYAQEKGRADHAEKEAEPTDVWRRRAETAEQALTEMTAHRDRCRDIAMKWQVEANRAKRRADESHPLTPADITLHSANSASWVRVRVEHPALGVIEEGIPLPTASAPNVVTDEMIERARRALREVHEDGDLIDGREVAHQRVAYAVLAAALTEPPARPEGAEDIEALIDRAGTEGEGADNESLADYLTRCGVRVTTEEDR